MAGGSVNKENVRPSSKKLAGLGEEGLLDANASATAENKSRKAHYEKKKENRKLRRAQEIAKRDLEQRQEKELRDAAQREREQYEQPGLQQEQWQTQKPQYDLRQAQEHAQKGVEGSTCTSSLAEHVYGILILVRHIGLQRRIASRLPL